MDENLTTEELDELAEWMEDHVAVHVAPGLERDDVEYGVLEPDRVRELRGSDVTSLEWEDDMQLMSLVHAYRHWQDRDDAPDGVVYESTLGTSPWRKRRGENPPEVPDGREDLVWMEWNGFTNGQFHKAVPDKKIPVVGGAKYAVLTTKSRAESLGVNACPDCFPDETDKLVSVTDESGVRTTVNTDLIDEVPDEALESLDTAVENMQDALDDE